MGYILLKYPRKFDAIRVSRTSTAWIEAHNGGDARTIKGPSFSVLCDFFKEQPIELSWYDLEVRHIGWVYNLMVYSHTKFNESVHYGAVIALNPQKPILVNRMWTIVGSQGSVNTMERHLRYDNFAEPRRPY